MNKLLTILALGILAKDAAAAALAIDEVVTGASHACALSAGRIKCWGENAHGQLGLGDIEDRGDETGEMGNALPFVDLAAYDSVTQIALGTDHTCALLGKGILKCWGRNESGQLGLAHADHVGDAMGEMGAALPTVNVEPGHRVVEVAAGGEHTCARLDDGRVKCWGGNRSGQLGLGHTSNEGDGILEMGTFLPAVDLGSGHVAVQITAGLSHTCALLESGAVRCWGENFFGQLGIGDGFARGDDPGEMGNALPVVSLGAGRHAVHIAAGNDHTCALLDDDTVKCWGRNDAGQLGQEDDEPRGDQAGELGNALSPIALGIALEPVSNISAGSFHNCALRGTYLFCWGSNISGQLAIGDRDDRGDDSGEMGPGLSASNLGTLSHVRQVDLGWIFGCAKFANRRVKCWGANEAGELGYGDKIIRGRNPNELGDSLPYVDLGNDGQRYEPGSFPP